MEQSVQELCWLLQEVLYKKTHDFTISDSERLYHIAKENGLSGTVFEVVQTHGIEDEYYKKFQKDFYSYVATDENQIAILKEVSELFDKNGIEYVLLKGARLKQLYPSSYMRSMGDVDILVNVSKMELVSSLLKEQEYETFATAYVHDVFNSKSGVHLEVHKRLSRFTKTEKFLENPWLYVKNGSFTVEFEIIYLLTHLRKHIKDSGIGLRSMIDFGVILNHYSGNINIDTLYHGLNEMDLLSLFLNVTAFNEKYLDLDLSEYLIENFQVDTALFENFTTYVVVSGMHGVGVSFNRFTGIMATMNKSKFVKFNFIFRKIFLPYNVLRDVYPKAVKNVILYPLGILLRIYDLTIVRRRINKRKLLEVSAASSSSIEYNATMFSKLGVK